MCIYVYMYGWMHDYVCMYHNRIPLPVMEFNYCQNSHVSGIPLFAEI